MKYILLVACLFIFHGGFSQTKEMELHIGRSVNGTGDMPGWGFSFNYSKDLKRHFIWSAGLGSTIHDGVFPVYYEYPAGVPVDGSIRYTVAGFQGTVSVGYKLVHSSSDEIIFSVGALARYQSSSYFDDVAVLFPVLTGLEYPVIVFHNRTPQRTVAVGAMPQLVYHHAVSKKIIIGLAAAYQFDTNGDNISHLSLLIGRRL